MALTWGAISGSPLLGLKLAAWIVALTIGGLLGLVHEYWRQQSWERWGSTADNESRVAVMSGLAYMVVGLASTWLPLPITIVVLVTVLIDFATDHPLHRVGRTGHLAPRAGVRPLG